MTILGTTTLGFTPLPLLVPVDGSNSEKLVYAKETLGGTTTVRRRAIKRRWSMNLAIVDSWDAARLQALFEATGPLSLYDASVSQLIPDPQRRMRGWVNAGSGVAVAPSDDYRLPVAGGVQVRWATGVLTPVRASSAVTLKIGAQASVASMSLTAYLQWYKADRTFLSTGSIGPFSSVSTSYVRLSGGSSTPATAAFVSMNIAATGAGTITVSDPTLVPGSFQPDNRSGWFNVHFEALSVSKRGNNKVSASLTLREV